MRIIVVSNIFPPDKIGGYEQQCAAMVRYLEEQGHEVRVLTSADGYYHRESSLRGSALQDGRSVDVKRVFAPISYYAEVAAGTYRPVQYARQDAGGVLSDSARALAIEIESYRPDVCYLFNTIGLGPLGILRTATSLVPTVVQLFDHIDNVCESHWLENDPFARAAYLTAKRKATAIACSSLIESTNTRLGPYAKSVVIPNWFDDAELTPSKNGVSSYRPGRDALRIAYFGQILPYKGVGTLVDAVLEHGQGGHAREITLEVYGRVGTFAIELQERCAARPGRVTFGGLLAKGELFQRLKSADLVVIPTHQAEPFAAAIIEAMALGLPVATTHPQPATDLLTPDRDFLPLPPGLTSSELADLIDQWADRSLEAIANSGCNTAWERFSLRRAVGPLVESVLADAASASTEVEKLGSASSCLERMCIAVDRLRTDSNFALPRQDLFRYRVVDGLVRAGDRAGIPWARLQRPVRSAGYFARRLLDAAQRR